MSTGGPDPNRLDESDPDVAHGRIGDPSASRLGLSSGVIVVIVLLVALAFLAVAYF
ncbi:MAG TPA: hypothetical protein VHG91_05615 [Longimicrobium sp.]|nr:hypothetical protein [Longimicrobium sp.]